MKNFKKTADCGSAFTASNPTPGVENTLAIDFNSGDKEAGDCGRGAFRENSPEIVTKREKLMKFTSLLIRSSYQ